MTHEEAPGTTAVLLLYIRRRAVYVYMVPVYFIVCVVSLRRCCCPTDEMKRNDTKQNKRHTLIPSSSRCPYKAVSPALAFDCRVVLLMRAYYKQVSLAVACLPAHFFFLLFFFFALLARHCTAGVKLTSGQRQECYDGVHYSDLTYDAFAQVREKIAYIPIYQSLFCVSRRNPPPPPPPLTLAAVLFTQKFASILHSAQVHIFWRPRTISCWCCLLPSHRRDACMRTRIGNPQAACCCWFFSR